jgi:hypothetical protein
MKKVRRTIIMKNKTGISRNSCINLLQFGILAHFFAVYRKKTGLSAPIPQPAVRRACGISASIPCAPRAFPVFGKTRMSFALILCLAFFAGCSSTGAAASGGLTGTWKLTEEDASSRVLIFLPDGTGTFNAYDAGGQTAKTLPLTHAPDNDTRFGIVGEKWVTYVPCEIQGALLTLKPGGQVFEKQ